MTQMRRQQIRSGVYAKWPG